MYFVKHDIKVKQDED